MAIKITSKDHIQGKEDASVVLIEYGDYQCPYCGKAFYSVKEAQKELGDNLKFIFRNFPLTEIHEHALHAAISAETASDQGKFWEMHDILFQNQNDLDDDSLIKYAEKIGLNTSKFEDDFTKNEHFQKVKEDYDSGIENGVQGTPAFFINGKLFEGNWSDSEFIEYLKKLVK